jgi:hypothetical protein
LPLTDSQVRSLRRKAAAGSLEVEHLLKVAALGDASDAPLLRQLRAAYGWPDSGRPGDDPVVPLGRWADVVCTFLKQGYAGLIRLARQDPGAVEFCIGLLEEKKTPESVAALLAIGGGVIDRPGSDRRLALRLAGALNLLLAFKGAPRIDEATAARVREFLHRLLSLDLSEAERAVCVCALRGVGDERSLGLIGRLPPFGGSWSGLAESASRQIKSRLRRRPG